MSSLEGVHIPYSHLASLRAQTDLPPDRLKVRMESSPTFIKYVYNWIVVSNIFYFLPRTLGKWCRFDYYFSHGLVQPPTIGKLLLQINSLYTPFFSWQPTPTVLPKEWRHLLKFHCIPKFSAKYISKNIRPIAYDWNLFLSAFFSVCFLFRISRGWRFFENVLPGLSVHDLEKGSNAFRSDVVSKEGGPHEWGSRI